MRIPRIYIPEDILLNTEFTLPDDAATHVGRVLRMKPETKLTLFNGQGGEYKAHICDVQRHKVTAIADNFVDRNCESPLTITLVQCISRGERMDYTIQKAVELGVTNIQPVFSQRSTVKLDEKRLARKTEHWQKTVISACEQSGRNYVPIVNPAINYSDIIDQYNDKDQLKLIMHTVEDADDPFTLSQLDSDLSHCVLLAGPEGGLTDDEVKLAEQHKFRVIQLGPRILRTETAALAMISVLQSHAGDMK